MEVKNVIRRRSKLNKINIDNTELTRNLIYYSKKDTDSIYEILNTDKNGISTHEAINRIEEYGLNQVEHERPTPWYIRPPVLISFRMIY